MVGRFSRFRLSPCAMIPLLPDMYVDFPEIRFRRNCLVFLCQSNDTFPFDDGIIRHKGKYKDLRRKPVLSPTLFRPLPTAAAAVPEDIFPLASSFLQPEAAGLLSHFQPEYAFKILRLVRQNPGITDAGPIQAHIKPVFPSFIEKSQIAVSDTSLKHIAVSDKTAEPLYDLLTDHMLHAAGVLLRRFL